MPTFKTTGILDDFNRADEGPPPSASWTTPTGHSGLSVNTNQCAGSGATNSGYWNPTTFGANAEAYATIAVLPGNSSVIGMIVRVLQPGSSTTFDGYGISFLQAAGTDSISIQRVDNGTGTTLGSTISQEISTNDILGILCRGSTISAWRESGGVISELGNRTDTTYAAGGNVLFVVQGTTGRIDDCGGGTAEVIKDLITSDGIFPVKRT